MPTQDELVQMLITGALGPWAGQGFVPGGITILRPDTMQWETILGDPGDADLMTSTLGSPVQASSTWSEPTVEEQALVDAFLGDAGVHGLETGVGITTTVGGSFGHPLLSSVSAANYTYLDFVNTTLGEIRVTEGLSNGSTGPLSPIRNGPNRDEVDKDGNVWLPVVRMNGVDAERRDGLRGPGGMW